VRPSERLRVQARVVVRLERILPECRDQHGRDHAEHGVLDVDSAELAALDAAMQDRGDEPQPAANHLVEVEAGEIREVAGFGDHQFGDGADAR
jgi:hypothetical protein